MTGSKVPANLCSIVFGLVTFTLPWPCSCHFLCLVHLSLPFLSGIVCSRVLSSAKSVFSKVLLSSSLQNHCIPRHCSSACHSRPWSAVVQMFVPPIDGEVSFDGTLIEMSSSTHKSHTSYHLCWWVQKIAFQQSITGNFRWGNIP